MSFNKTCRCGKRLSLFCLNYVIPDHGKPYYKPDLLWQPGVDCNVHETIRAIKSHNITELFWAVDLEDASRFLKHILTLHDISFPEEVEEKPFRGSHRLVNLLNPFYTLKIKLIEWFHNLGMIKQLSFWRISEVFNKKIVQTF